MSNIRKFGQLIAKNIYNKYGGIITRNIPLYCFLGKRGNLKIPITTAIFNMSSAHNCPSKRLGLCKAKKFGVKCYAIRAETSMYKLVQPYRERQQKFWLKVSAEQFAMQFILINSFRKKEFTALRMNEAGDFHSQDCVNKAEKIARILKPYGVTVYGYTSRDDLDYSHVEAMRISGSGFKKPGIVNIFQIIDKKEDKLRGYGMCAMNCRICNRCLRAGLRTCVVKH